MTPNKNNILKKENSKQWIVNSLLDLLSKKKYKEITISEISDNAYISRRTFYRHFKIINDVLAFYFNNLYKEFREKLLTIENLDFKKVLFNFFTFWEQRKDLLIVLEQNNLIFLLISNFVPDFALENKLNSADDENNNYSYFFVIGGIWSVLIKWLENKSLKTPNELTEIINSVVIKINSF